MQTISKDLITRETIKNAHTFDEFVDLTERLHEDGKVTNGNNTEAMLGYTKLNLQRFRRVYKTTKLKPEVVKKIKNTNREMVWLVINEGWCGDSAQSLPVLARIADESERITLKVILRDENLEIMDQYLTNGGRSVPKLIALDAKTFEELGTWGPRPEEAQNLYDKMKEDETSTYQERATAMQKWYSKNKGTAVQEEIADLLQEWENK